ncbi:MAG: polysaccharide deacetylase family protein [Chitinophagaceae bacterium]|nr:polysaccharide deacetylase family protein [Chitinophagaceae bacterium]
MFYEIQKVVIYSKIDNVRLQYVLDIVFRLQLGLPYELTHDIEYFLQSQEARINYSHEKLGEKRMIQMIPNELIEQTDIRPQPTALRSFKGIPVICRSGERDDQFPFDLFSAVFYLLTRYEEYIDPPMDQHDRFHHRASLAFEYEFLHAPLVDIWILELKKTFTLMYRDMAFPAKKFTYIPTYDIDMAWSYKHKGFLRNTGGLLRDIYHKKFDRVKERVAVCSGRRKDPFDTFAYLDQLHAQYDYQPIYFFLAGERGTYDKNIAPTHPAMKKLIADTRSKYDIGVHPSYGSHFSDEQLKKEIDLIGSKKSRQHYIKFKLPETYRNLIRHGITQDYSMGYGSINGYRASTSFPYLWFDLERNVVTPLEIHSFSFMDCNALFEENKTPDQAFYTLKEMVKSVEVLGGTMMTVWHNFSLGSDPQWAGWREMYEAFFAHVKSLQSEQ